MKKFVVAIFLHCVLPLLIGALVYLFFRPAFFTNLPKVTIQHAWLKPVLFTLPDFCWSYSFACALYFFSIVYQLPFKKIGLLIFIGIIGSEVVQLFFPRYFTFDVFDLAATILAFALSTFQMKKIAYENEF